MKLTIKQFVIFAKVQQKITLDLQPTLRMISFNVLQISIYYLHTNVLAVLHVEFGPLRQSVQFS